MDDSWDWRFLCPQSNHSRLSLVVSGERWTHKAMNIIHVKGWQQGSLGPLIYSLQLQEWWRDSHRDPPFGYLSWSRCLPPFPYLLLFLNSTLIFILLFPALWPCHLQYRACPTSGATLASTACILSSPPQILSHQQELNLLVNHLLHKTSGWKARLIWGIMMELYTSQWRLTFQWECYAFF